VLIVVVLIAMALGGIALVATAFRRELPKPSAIPVAQVGGPTTPPRARIRVSVGRLFAGLLLLVFGAAAVLFILGVAELARVSSH